MNRCECPKTRAKHSSFIYYYKVHGDSSLTNFFELLKISYSEIYLPAHHNFKRQCTPTIAIDQILDRGLSVNCYYCMKDIFPIEDLKRLHSLYKYSSERDKDIEFYLEWLLNNSLYPSKV